MKYEELVKYANDFINANDTPEVYTIGNEGPVQNMPDSSDRLPQGHIGWINYWRAFSQDYRDFVNCSCCGKTISVHKEPDSVHSAFAMLLPENYDYAEGGHIILKNFNGIKDGIYITPLCAECNNQFGETFTIKSGSIIVQEVNPDIVKSDNK